MLMPQPNAKTSHLATSSGANDAERTASLNADGSLNWFIPPYVIPAFIVLLVAARSFWLA
jgi:hypothetical protein